MDLLSKRYANPCFFLDGMIQTGRLEEFVENIVDMTNSEKEEETMWEYYLHRAIMYEGSFNDFVEESKVTKEHANMPERTIETTVQHSMDILNNFNPEKGGE
jgi:hypothetical protein